MPRVVPPVGACSDRVRVQGQRPGSTVTILAGMPGAIADEVFRGTAARPDETFGLSRRLIAGERVHASESGPGVLPTGMIYEEIVQPEPDGSEIGNVSPASHLHACALCGAFACFPGAEVTITSSARGDLGRGIFDPSTGSARVQFAHSLLNGEVLFGSQSVCGHSGPVSPLPLPDRPRNEHGKLPAPLIAEPLMACDTGVRISGILEGAVVRMFRDGEPYASACFDYSTAWFLIHDRLKAGEKVWFDQIFRNCELSSDLSPAIQVEEADGISQPVILSTLCAHMSTIGVGQLRYGATVTLI